MPKQTAEDRHLVFSSASLDKVTVSHPSLVALPKGKLIASVDLTGPGVKNQPGKKGKNAHTGHLILSRIIVSDDGGETWEAKGSLPFGSARLFRVDASIYALGHSGNLWVGHSSDGGNTWRTAELTTATGSRNNFVLGPANVLVADGYVNAAFTMLTDPKCKGNTASAHALVLARAPTGANLEKPGSWTFSREAPAFRDQLSERAGHAFGLPWYDVPKPDRGVDLARNRWANRIGWTEAHLAKLHNPKHLWYDPAAIHVLAGLYSHRANFGSLLHVDTADAALSFDFEHSPAGVPMPFLPLPGAHQKFDLTFDEKSGLYLLVGLLPRDSMTALDQLGGKRPGLPVDERQRLALHVSPNLIDWHCAAVICEEPVIYEPAIAIHGEHLHVVARAAPADPVRHQNTLEAVHYRLEHFRALLD